MAEYVTREGTVAAADTRTGLTTLGSEASPGAITVPTGTSRIAQIIAAIAADGTGVGAATWVLRISGNGVKNGEQTMALGACGGTLATSDIQTNGAIVVPVDIPVSPGKQVTLSAEMCGTDLGTSEVAVTIAFQ